MTAHNEKTPAVQGEGISGSNTKEETQMTHISVHDTTDNLQIFERISDKNTFHYDQYRDGQNVYAGTIHVVPADRRVEVIYPQGTPAHAYLAMRRTAEEHKLSGLESHAAYTITITEYELKYPEDEFVAECVEKHCEDDVHLKAKGSPIYHVHRTYVIDKLGTTVRVEKSGKQWRVDVDVSQTFAPKKAQGLASAIANASAIAASLNKEAA